MLSAAQWAPVRAAMEEACARYSSYWNQIFRRLRHYEKEDEWMAAVRDGAALVAEKFGIFTVSAGVARLRMQEGLGAPESLEIAVTEARAFAAAVESREPVVALATAGEVGNDLQEAGSAGRAHLYPIANTERVAALLFARESEGWQASGMELLAGMAAVVLERNVKRGLDAQIGPVVEVKRQPVRAELPGWAQLNCEQRLVHIKAQRFARSAVAQMQVGRPAAARAGREGRNWYMLFGAEVDKAREAFRRQFMTVPSMVDYLHLELVKTAGAGDESRLGVDYPGPLV